MNQCNRILIVDGDAVAAAALSRVLTRHGYACEQAVDADTALVALDRADARNDGSIAVLVIDQDCAGHGAGLDLIQRLHDDRPALVPIVISGFRKVESAVRAMRCGAADYLLKPVVEADLITAVERAVQRHLLHLDVAPVEEAETPQESDKAAESPAAAWFETPEPNGQATAWTPMPLAEAMKAPERRILLAALEANGWNRGETARQLDINRTTLYKKIRQYRLDVPG